MKKKLLTIMLVTVMSCGLLIGWANIACTNTTLSTVNAIDLGMWNKYANSSNYSSPSVDEKKDYIEIPVEIINDTDFDLAEFYVAGANVDTWGTNLVPSGKTFEAGDTLSTIFYIDIYNLEWDFKLVDCNDDELVITGLDLSSCDPDGITLTITYDHKTKIGTITAK